MRYLYRVLGLFSVQQPDTEATVTETAAPPPVIPLTLYIASPRAMHVCDGSPLRAVRRSTCGLFRQLPSIADPNSARRAATKLLLLTAHDAPHAVTVITVSALSRGIRCPLTKLTMRALSAKRCSG